jgi:hypothetical protein
MQARSQAPLQAPLPARPHEEPLERYLNAAMDTAQRAALTAVRALREPRPPADPIAALRTVERLAESLTGFAVGAALLPLAQRLSRAGGPEVKAAIRQSLAALAGPDGPAALTVPPPTSYGPQAPRFLADADQRPLVDELGARLCARLPLARGDGRALLRQLFTAAERAMPESAQTLAVALHAVLDDVSPIAERVAPAVHQAWQHAISVMHDRPILTGAWAPWSRCAAGLPEPKAELTAADVVAAGYVMRVG